MSRLLLTAMLCALSPQAAAVSDVFTYQGTLEDAGAPANGPFDLRFELVGPGPLPPAQILEDVAVSRGVFSVELDFGAAIASGNYSLQVGVRPGASSGAFTALNPATPIRPTPQAQVAGLATEAVTVSPNAVGSAGIADGSVGGADIDGSQVQRRVAGTCGAGQAMASVAVDGTVTCRAVGSVTSVGSGAGLTGGPITGSGTLSIATGGVSSAMIADGAVGAVDVNTSQLQLRVGGNCAVGSSIRAIAADGSVTCELAAATNWALAGNSGTSPATNFLGTTDAQALVLRTGNAQSLRLEPSSVLFGSVPNTSNLIAGSQVNGVSPGVRGASVIGGGAVTGSEGGIQSGGANRATDNYTLAGGGYDNVAGNRNASTTDAAFATALGGASNLAAGEYSVVLGGSDSQARGARDLVLGGNANIADAGSGLVAGGFANTVTGNSAVALGGANNCAGGQHSFAAGSNAVARPAAGADAGACGAVANSGDANGDEGTFVWADRSSGASFASSGPNQFLVRADGGMLINTNTLVAPGADDLVLAARVGGDNDADLRMRTSSGRSGLIFVRDSNGGMSFAVPSLAAGADRLSVSGGVGGTATLSNGGSWNNASSRTFKTGFTAIDPLDILERVVSLPITRWTYRGSEEGTHLGPMAEDFKAAFDLAGNGQSIATVDADGVALAAIQGLNQKLESENAELRRRLSALEAAVHGR